MAGAEYPHDSQFTGIQERRIIFITWDEARGVGWSNRNIVLSPDAKGEATQIRFAILTAQHYAHWKRFWGDSLLGDAANARD